MPFPFASARRVSPRLITAFVVADIALAALVNLVLFPSPFFDPLERATRGLVNATLQANLLLLALIVGGLFLGLGKLRPADLGWRWRDLLVASVTTAGLWTAAQALLAAGSLAATGFVPVAPAWTERGAPVVLGRLAGQLFGNALFEETAFRGFLLVQLYLRLESLGPRRRLAAALLISQGIFALMHIPNRLFAQLPPAQLPLDLLSLLALGLVYAAITLRTGNLFIAVGVHALANAPTTLVGTDAAGLVVLALGVLLAAAWPWLARAPARARKTSPRATA